MVVKLTPMRFMRYLLESLLAFSLYIVLRLMPLDAASALGGWAGRMIGPHVSAHKTALKNLKFAMPELTDAQAAKITEDMWDNFGRVFGEYPHLPRRALSDRLTIDGAEHVRKAVAEGKTILFISGHMGNWEMAPKTAWMLGVPLVLVYRPANNPVVDKLIHYIRGSYYAGMFRKGPSAAIRVVKALKKGQAVGMLVDQKMNDGISVPFFGHPAMTAPAMAQFGLKYDLAVIPARVVRTSGAHFVTKILPPLELKRTGNEKHDAANIMVQVNEMLEGWIRENPAQWLWVHKRWGK